MKLKPKICLVVTGQTINQFLINLKLAQAQADLIELRVDFIQNLSIKHLNIIKNQTHKTGIFTCRPKRHLASHHQLIKKADQLGFDFIDLELETLQKNPIELNQSQLIVSHHDFSNTLSFSKLKNILVQMDAFKPAIKKIATLVKSDQDLLTLTKLLITKKPSEKLIVIGMSQKAKLTRILFPLFGSYLTYASLKNLTSAPGQIDINKLKLFYQSLNSL